MKPRYPIYIVSKGRWDYRSRQTSRALDAIEVPYHIAVEPQEYDNYAEEIPEHKLLVLPFGNHGQGPTKARNWCWKHSINLGTKRHWVMDDNIDGFFRLNRNIIARAETGAIFRAAEDFVDRYENVPLSGLQYFMFCNKNAKVKPYTLNTRIYSCLLIENSTPYRWRGKYNEDTDLSLRILKDGLCTVEFNAFLQNKTTTQILKGGNTEEFYKHEGTLKKSKYLVDLHPDVARVVWRFNRWHHHVDYGPFKKNKLIKKKNLNISSEVDNYGMVLVDTSADIK